MDSKFDEDRGKCSNKKEIMIKQTSIKERKKTFHIIYHLLKNIIQSKLL